MKTIDRSGRVNRTLVTRVAAALVASAGLPVLVGCEWDSYINPSVVGRWERTPTIVPILERISSIEDRTGEFVEYADPTPEDLLPAAEPYRLGAGDQLDITLWDDIQRNQPNQYQRTVDARGFVDLPQLGQIPLSGLTVDQAREEVARVLGRLVAEPIVDLNVVSARNQVFTLLGSVESPGPYLVPRADYPLLEALSSGGRFPEGGDFVYVVRQVPLSDRVRTPEAGAAARQQRDTGASTPAAQPTPQDGNNLIDLIDKLSQPEPGAAPAGQTPSTPPPVDLPDSTQPVQPSAQPIQPSAQPNPTPTPPADAPPPIDLPDSGSSKAGPGSYAAFGTGARATMRRQPGASAEPPVVDLPDSLPQAGTSSPSNGGSNWVFLNGKWVQVSRPLSAVPGSAASEQLLTQRVIRVPLQSLLTGEAKYNIIVRPGDIVRVPQAPSGVVYVDGQVQRPGVYNLPESGRLTLTQVITATGGYGEQAIPERTDLVRRLSNNRQATIRVDLRAIAEGTQPDIYLKPDDRVNVGTNFWALPLAVVRNGFRMNYGFGFLLDRNFGNDVFGPPPDDRQF